MADKVTLSEFGKKLKDYANAGAARKAVGRFGGWSDKAKAQARNMIDKHFGSEPAPAKTKVKAKPGPKPKRAEKAAKGTKMAPKAKRAYRKQQVEQTAPSGPSFGPLMTLPLSIQAQQLLQVVNIASRNIKRLHALSPTVEIGDAVSLMIEFNNNALKILGQNVKPVEIASAEVTPAPAPVVRKTKSKAPVVSKEISKGNGEGTLEGALGSMPESAPVASNMATV